MNHDDMYSPAERDRLAQELLELHFGCHDDPAALAARLAAEPALRALQAEMLQQARVLENAAKPEQAPLALREPQPLRSPWRILRSSTGRLLTAAVLAATVVLGFFVAERVANARLRAHEAEHLSMTVSAPRAIPAGSPWSFTVQAQTLDGENADARVRWRAFGSGEAPLAAGEAPLHGGSATIAMPALPDLRVPERIEVVAASATDEVRQMFSLSAAAAGPLVHVTTDREVYQPGDTVCVRAVVLDRLTLLPWHDLAGLSANLRDAKGALVAQSDDPAPRGGVGSFFLKLPDGDAGGQHRVEVTTSSGTFAAESLDITVRPFEAPKLRKAITLDRATYAPGMRGSAAVAVTRLDGNVAAANAQVKGALVVDGTEVWSERRALDDGGHATFAFAVPRDVEKGAARFVATVTDGGVVETEVRPFVVPLGKVTVACYPEGGELVAGVANALYLECTDPLDRFVDTGGALLDDRGTTLAKFTTAHQGRAKVEFRPEAGRGYAIRLAGQSTSQPVPEVVERGIAMRLVGDDLAANAPLRMRLAGRGDGPWLLGVFCRGALVGQTTLQPNERGELDATAEVTLAEVASGVLRATLFDRTLQPIAERLVRRASTHRIQVELAPLRSVLAPTAAQTLTVRTTDELGRPIAAFVGVSVTDQGTASLASEPRIGLADHAMLFADVERLEDLGSLLLGNAASARNVDLLLGTRGWRRFVWRNDAAAQAAIAAHGSFGEGVLAREGFSQTPQVVGNGDAANSAGAALAAVQLARSTNFALCLFFCGLVLALMSLVEGIWQMGRHRWVPGIPKVVFGFAGLACLACLLLLPRVYGAAMRSPFGKPPRETYFERGVDKRFADFSATILVDELTDSDFLESAFDSSRWNAAIGLGEAKPGWRQRHPAPGAAFLPPRIRDIPGEDPDLPRLRVYAHRHIAAATRDDFAPMVYWNPLVVTDANGAATVSFDTSDAVTTWLAQADAHVGAGTPKFGRVGQGEARFTTQLPFHIEVAVPDEVSAGDELLLPVTMTVGDPAIPTVSLVASAADGLALADPMAEEFTLVDGRARALVRLRVDGSTGIGTFAVRGHAGGFTDTITREVRIAPRGFPHRRSFGGSAAADQPSELQLTIPTDAVRGSGRALLKVYPSPITSLTEGLAGILQEPHGCFEQASSSNYPNTLVLTLLEANGDNLPVVAARARELLPRGYAKIAGYECKQRGYEWFGADPGHEALTAYGLLEFHDMAKVYAVDQDMVERTRQWLLARRDGQGNFAHHGPVHHSFGGGSQAVNNAYCTYALLVAGTAAGELQPEIGALLARATTGDPYELALIAGALRLADRSEAAAARRRLAAMQRDDGSLQGTTTSITMSGGNDLVVETTGHAVLAWLGDANHAANVRRAVDFLQTRRTASGTFGATQATITALRAMTAYATESRTFRKAGTVRVREGDLLLGERAFAADSVEPLAFELWDRLAPGPHTLWIDVTGGGTALPWACDVAYHAEQPADDPASQVAIATTLRARTVVEGDTVALDVTITNRTDEALPMAMAIVGLPAGTEVATRVLEDLQKSGQFAFWELRGRELALYWRDLAPRAELRVTLDLTARIPGSTSGPASRAYLYYTAEQKQWAAPLRLSITPRQ